MFDSPLRLFLGLITGVAFGVLLQKGRVAKHGVIVGQLVLRDFTVIKIMLTAIAVGAAGFWALVALGVTELSVKPAQMGGILAGALLFGSGLAVLGYCPGTTVAAVGEGRRDALAGVLGMLGGALTFVVGFSTFARVQGTLVDWGTITLPDATDMAPALYLTILGVLAAGLYVLARHVNKRKGHAS